MIPIQNIYYMLSYAFQVLKEQEYKKIATEDFDNVAELCSAILVKGMSVQIKRGLGREYIQKTEPLSTLRGRIEMSESIRSRSMLRKQMVCSYDDFSVNSYMNRIIKTTMLLPLRSDISKSRKKDLRKILVYLSEVEELDVYTIDWNQQYNRNNQTYQMLISVCYLVIKGLLQTNSDGKEFPQLNASASQIPWGVDDGFRTMLPIMQSDITLSHGENTLIIDAKYYSRTTQSQYDVHTLHSNNLYQIFTYVKNKEVELAAKPHTISGMLLYAQTDEEVQPNNIYHMSGNKITVRTLDLNQYFSNITDQLDQIVREHFSLPFS